jgi:DNA repair and recombination protein RAD54 and RAD54-like protein
VTLVFHLFQASRRRANFYEGHSKEADEMDCGPIKLSEDFIVADIAIHPRHAKQMRSHQLEGFNFLVKNLVADKPGGCILAHAPGSGKTFMLISFIQSFVARYPSARPLIVLPKGIVGHWKDEVRQWQVQDIPLYDFYSVKAEKRVEQLEVLKSWESKMSILFLGYTQFSRIVSGDGGGSVAAACRDRLLKVPNLLILDEGHKPRNRDTDVLETLNRVETSRKVVLSGTLFQNHVREVFTILDLVRPKFLKMESSRPIVRRIMSQVEISGRPSKGIADSAFFEAVEKTLLNDDNFNRKSHVIRSLRELTKDVLHYYKGDMLDELPGLVDFSVFLKLTPKQKDIVHKLGAYEKFKRNAVGTALYVHPCLSEISKVNAEDRVNSLTDKSVDSLIDSINVRDGAKARFFMNILSLAESAGEKLLAFSQYILPMKFLERLLVKIKGWHVGKEIFVISGDASADDRDFAKDQFNSSTDAKVLFGSIKACGEGISLVGASRVIILDVHLNPSVTRQAIGRAFRPGQRKKVFVYRLVAAESPEEKDHETAFKKEVIPKLWFEWSEQCTTGDFKLDHIDIDDCGDELLDSKAMRKDIKALYKR